MQYLKAISAIFVLFTVGCVVVVEQPMQNQNQLAVSSVWDNPTSIAPKSRFFIEPHFLEQVSKKHPEVISVYSSYQQAIVKKISRRNFLLSNETADYKIVFGIALADDLNDDMIALHFGVTPGLHAQVELLKGSFMMYVEDMRTGQRIWRGTVQGFVQQNTSPEQRGSRAEKVVNLILDQFFTAG